MDRRWAIVLVAVFFVAAGCLDETRETDSQQGSVKRQGQVAKQVLPVPADWAELAVGLNHDHADISLHQNTTTANFEVLGNDPLVTDYYGSSSGGYFCGAAQEHEGRRLSVVHSFVSDVALIVIDITDPTDPQKIGELTMSNTQVYDTALTPDLRYALMATSPLDGGPDKVGADPVDAPPVFTWQDACTGEERILDGPEQGLPLASGVVLVDLANPRVPAIADFRPLPAAGAHSVRAYDIDGRNIALTSALNPPVGYAGIFEIQDLSGPKLVPLSVVFPDVDNAEESGGPKVTYIHDAYIHKHPITEDWILYLAWGTQGLVLMDVNDLMRPTRLTYWHDWEPVGGADSGGHFVHEALPIDEVWDGRHYTFIGEECGGRPAEVPTCLVMTLDTTDPANPQFVGAWTLPVDVSWTGQYQFSTHYIGLSNKTLMITNYHGGVWAVDVSTPEARQRMPSIGVFLPTIESSKPWTGFGQGTTGVQVLFADVQINSKPLVLDLDVLPDGTLVVWEHTTGVYLVHFDEARPAPAPELWPFPYHSTLG